ncbi:hypothetical protein KV557_37260 [Kitasatospora aureofaciens]|nr:hypothetical protein [Kitasatospora aureofaciens]MBV6702690.1 hypothetical protein [Kitasatospora aureofaciens]
MAGQIPASVPVFVGSPVALRTLCIHQDAIDRQPPYLRGELTEEGKSAL